MKEVEEDKNQIEMGLLNSVHENIVGGHGNGEEALTAAEDSEDGEKGSDCAVEVKQEQAKVSGGVQREESQLKIGMGLIKVW